MGARSRFIFLALVGVIALALAGAGLGHRAPDATEAARDTYLLLGGAEAALCGGGAAAAHGDGCPLCHMAGAALVPSRSLAAVPLSAGRPSDLAVSSLVWVRAHRGLPQQSRAPPRA